MRSCIAPLEFLWYTRVARWENDHARKLEKQMKPKGTTCTWMHHKFVDLKVTPVESNPLLEEAERKCKFCGYTDLLTRKIKEDDNEGEE